MALSSPFILFLMVTIDELVVLHSSLSYRKIWLDFKCSYIHMNHICLKGQVHFQ